MNILFVNANLYGHINPTLGLVKSLQKKGIKLIISAQWNFRNR